MREIKFRAWDKENKEMLNVEELNYEDSFNGKPMIKTTMYNDYFDTENMILMQYTGLKDKNLTEIFEGDIIAITGQCIFEIGKIIFLDGCFFAKGKKILLPLYECKMDEYELKVMGNIYENPELLGE